MRAHLSPLWKPGRTSQGCCLPKAPGPSSIPLGLRKMGSFGNPSYSHPCCPVHCLNCQLLWSFSSYTLLSYCVFFLPISNPVIFCACPHFLCILWPPFHCKQSHPHLWPLHWTFPLPAGLPTTLDLPTGSTCTCTHTHMCMCIQVWKKFSGILLILHNLFPDSLIVQSPYPAPSRWSHTQQ